MKAGAKSSTRAAVGSPGSRRGGSATPPSPTAPDIADATAAGHGTPPSPRSPAARGGASAPAPSLRVPRVELFRAPLTPISDSVMFKGKSYPMKGSVTKYGDYTVDSKSWTALVIGRNEQDKETLTAVANHYDGIVERSPELRHQKKKLFDSIEVCLGWNGAGMKRV